MPHDQYSIGDTVECIAFNNAFGNWKAGIVRGKRRAGLRYEGTSWCHGANMTSDSAMACIFIMNIFTCFMLKPRCCPDQYVYDIEYPSGRRYGLCEACREGYLKNASPGAVNTF